MTQLVDLVRKYLAAKSLDERMEIGAEIHREVALSLGGFIYPQCQNGDAEDLQQEVVIAIFRSLARFEGNLDAQFWGFCYRIARNKISDYWRRKGSKPELTLDPEDLMRVAEALQEDASLGQEEQDRYEEIILLLQKTKPQCYELLWQCFVQGIDYSELAVVYAADYDTVSMRVWRCLKIARTLVAIGD